MMRVWQAYRLALSQNIRNSLATTETLGIKNYIKYAEMFDVNRQVKLKRRLWIDARD